MRLSRRALPLLFATAAATPSLAAGRPSNAADVRRHGATGDGTTDDSRAIQSAIDSGASLVAFPAGRYLCRRPLVPRSHQTWRGEGAAASLLVQPTTNAPPPFNLVEKLGILEDFAVGDIGFAGNGSSHRADGGPGQQGFAVYVRGLQRRLRFSRCHFAGFGGGRASGGGVVLGPHPDSEVQGLEDITVSDCVFKDNANVPGVYLAGGGRAGAARRNVRVVGNRFGGVPAGTRPQNCVYILADGTATRIANVQVADNMFDIASPVDACIELNWVEGFAVSGNTIAFTAAVRGSSGILLRDGCRSGTIAGNSLRDASGEQVVAIDLVNFADPATIEDVTISGNVVHGFTWRGIAVDRGARGVVIAGNRVAGGERPLGEALRIVDARDVLVGNNAVSGATVAIGLASGDGAAAGVRAVSVAGNLFSDCGGDGPLIALVRPGADVRGLVVEGNHVTAPRPGSTALAGGGFATAEGNLLGRNLTAGLAHVMPGEERGWEQVPP